MSEAGWRNIALRRLINVKSGDSLTAQDFSESGFPVFGGNGFRGYYERANTPEDTVLIGRVGALCGNIHRVSEPFWSTEHAFRVRMLVECDLGFIEYLLRSLDLGQFASKSAQPVLNSDAVRNHNIRLPDLFTQKAIADFLDRETARIDQLIEKKQRLVKVFREREEAAFLGAVTGQNFVGSRKPSGVEWIGTIPAHWKAPKFTQVARQETGHTPSRKEPSYWVPEECVIPWVSLADIWQVRKGDQVYISETAEKISQVGVENSAARLLPANTVILSRTASVGFPAIIKEPMATTQDFACWICGKHIRPKYLYYVLRAMKPEFRRLMMGSTHQTIYMPDIRAFRTPLPLLQEQDAITAKLDASLGRFREAATAVEASIGLLREFRAALITAAVTGQIDVTPWGRRGETDRRLDRIEEAMRA